MPAYQIIPVPAFKDNYLWVLRKGDCAAVVDPGDAAPVLDYLRENNLRLTAILITHHHNDHIGGVPALTGRFPAKVYAPRDDRIGIATQRVGEGDTVTLEELDARFKVLEVPGHTRAHIAYADDGSLFCGDTLFAAGCGRMFEGTPPQMHASLQKLAALPADTAVYCAHEYTLSNIAFARAVEPDNAALAQREKEAQALRGPECADRAFPPSLELATNPFLRCAEPTVRAAAQSRLGRPTADTAETFGVIREWKNSF